MKAIRISVYKSNLGDCSNGGITSRYNELLLACEDGYIEVDESNPPENLVKIVTRRWAGGQTYKHLEPVAPAKGVGYMAGGCIGYTCDSRFNSEYPLSIHDRDETQEEYDMYSN